ncbi:MAG: 4Fe-4S binding protein [Deltaproteobacteria bacterium]|nr:4Fe-4S binding protein [Deltaproteobacteria bacterium]
MEVLRILFKPEEAELVARMPFTPTSAGRIAKRVGKKKTEVLPLLQALASRGAIVDIHDEAKGRSWYCVAPPVVGFFEFSMMRRREDVDQKKLSEAYHRMWEDGFESLPTLMEGQTTLGRTLVNEDSVSAEVLAETLTWERATEVVSEASDWSASLCYCRHKAEHMGEECEAPMDICMALNGGAKYVVNNGLGRRLDRKEAMDKLAQARESKLVHIADNVQEKVTWLCSCCGCCCMQLRAINEHGLETPIRTSPFVARVDHADRCRGCGKCARRCPIQAITQKGRMPVAGERSRLRSEVDESVCLGCGLCALECRHDALHMVEREQTIITPEGTLERVLVQALERDKLQHLIFDDAGGLSLAVLNRLTGAVLRMPPLKRALLGDRLRSRFIGFLAKSAKKSGAEI